MGNLIKTFTTTLGNTISKMSFKVEKDAPQILMVVGIVGVGAALAACIKETLELPEIIEEATAEKEAIKEKYKDERAEEDVPTDAEKKEQISLYVDTVGRVAKLYLPTIILTVFSVGCIVSGQKILIRNNIALTAAYASLAKEFDEYRKNTKQLYGDDVDKQLRFAAAEDNPDQTKLLGGTRYSFNEQTSKYWKRSTEDNVYFITIVCDEANVLLEARGHLFVNDVLEMLGMEPTIEGHDKGWIYDKNVEHKIDFGIYLQKFIKAREEMDGINETGIWLEMNVDGDIRHCLKAA